MKKKWLSKVFAITLSLMLILAIIPMASVSADAVGVYTYGYEDAYVYGSKVERSQAMAHSGDYSLKANTSGEWQVIQAPLYDGNACGEYHTLVVDFWMYIEPTFNLSKLTEPMRVYTYSGQWCGSYNTEKGATFNVDQDFLGHWSHVSVTFSNNTLSKQIPYLYIMQCEGFGGDVYIDDVTITTLSYGTYSGGSAKVLKDAHHDFANNDIIVPAVTGGTIPTPTRSGFTFEGWYTENSHENRVTTYSAGVNTYYAKWRGTVWDGTTAASYDGGNGTAANPYKIATGAQLSKLCGSSGGATAGQYFKLTDDIMLNDISNPAWRSTARGWKSTSNYLEYDFSGNFDGNGHVISGIYINNASDNRMGGLFPSLRSSAVVENVGITDSSITFTGATSFAGGIAGASDGSFTIRNCFVASTVELYGVHTAAGLIGKVDSNSAQTATVENAYSLAKLKSPGKNFGLFGYMWRNYTGTVVNVYTVGYDVFCNNGSWGSMYAGVSNDYSSVKIDGDHTHTVVARRNMLGNTAQSYLTGFDYTNVWGTAEGKYPYLKAFGSAYAEGPVLPSDFKTKSLVLAERIGINFFMDLSVLTAEEKADAYMTFEVSNYEKTIRDDFDSEDVNAGGSYCFTCLLTSVEMAETVVPILHYGDGKTLTGASYSVKEYIDTVVANSESFSDNVVLLVRALGDYGHYAQIYLANRKGWTAGEDYTVMPKYRNSDYTSDHYSAYLSNLAGEAMVKNIEGSAVTRVTYNLNFGTGTYININMTSSETITASALVAGERIAAGGDGSFRTQGLMITKLGDRFTLTGTGSSNTMPFSVTLSGLSYIRSILNKETESVAGAKNAVASLYDYYNAAMSYVTYNETLDGEYVSE